LVREGLGKQPLGISKQNWEDNIKMASVEIVYVGGSE
jgi:hypothetical protein